MRVRSFSLIEVLTALVVAASLLVLTGSIFSNLLNHRIRSEYTHDDIKIDVALQLLAADIENSIDILGRQSAVKITPLENGGFEFSFKKLFYVQEIVNVKILDVVWKFDTTKISRSLEAGLNPIVLVHSEYDMILTPIDIYAIRVDLETEAHSRSVVLWRQGKRL